jgi:hypothetical protein
MSKHSPTPWKTPLINDAEIVDANGYDVASMSGIYNTDYEKMEANAAHIVHCVNTYPELVKALEPFAEIADIILRDNPSTDDGQMIWSNGCVHREHISYAHIRAARAALAKAKVK